MKDITANIFHCRRLEANGKSHEEIIAYLRSQGCSKLESIFVLVKALQMELIKAKETVHLSKTWADVRDRDDKFLDSLEKELEDESSV